MSYIQQGGAAGGSGTVTSVGETINSGASSGIFTVTGSPVTTAGTIDLATAGTSGGIPYFSSATVVSSSAVLAANALVKGGGAGVTPASSSVATDDGTTLTYTGTGGVLSTTSGGLKAGANGGAAGVLSLNGSTSGAATLTAPAVAGTVANAVALTNSLTVGGPQVTVSAAGAGNGVLALSGNTSGTATLTAPAVAGTSTNAVVSSNGLSLPIGSTSNPTLTFTGATNTGIWESGNGLVLTGNGNGLLVTSTLVRASSGSTFAWASGDTGSTGADTGLSRLAAGVAAFGTGAANSKVGLIQSGMSKFVAANFTTSGVGTALEVITGLAITVPALAANWTFHAHIAYSQAVGTAAVAFGIQAATNNPTNIFATGELFTAAGTVTTGVLATLATTTATTIVSGTPGGTGTNLVCDLYGTCELGASANTIQLLVSTATAADLVTVLRGSYLHFNC